MSKIWAPFGHILGICPNFGHLLVTFWTFSMFGHILAMFWTHLGHILVTFFQNVSVLTSFRSTPLSTGSKSRSRIIKKLKIRLQIRMQAGILTPLLSCNIIRVLLGRKGKTLRKGLLSWALLEFLGCDAMRATMAALVICGGRLRGDKTSMTHFRSEKGRKEVK